MKKHISRFTVVGVENLRGGFQFVNYVNNHVNPDRHYGLFDSDGYALVTNCTPDDKENGYIDGLINHLMEESYKL